MKKILSVLLALAMLLMPVLSLAEAAEATALDFTIYLHTDGQYAFAYPNNWTLLTAENVETVMDAASEIDDPELAQIIAQYGSQVQQSGMIMVLSETGLTNVNVVAQNVGARATDEDLLALAPQLVSQLSNAMGEIRFTDEGSIVKLGNNTGLLVGYEFLLAGVDMCGLQAYIPGETNLYIITYTTVEDEESATFEDLCLMLGSLTVK